MAMHYACIHYSLELYTYVCMSTMETQLRLTPYIRTYITSIDVLPFKKQALCKYCTHVHKELLNTVNTLIGLL